MNVKHRPDSRWLKPEGGMIIKGGEMFAPGSDLNED
jgi:hypothetical protein